MSVLKKPLFGFSYFTLSCLLLCFSVSFNLTAQEQNNDASQLIQNKEYKEALEILKGNLADDGLLLLRARAQLLNDQYEDAIATAKKLTSEHPKSEWIHKANYIQAQAHSKLRAYEPASSIYEKEAESLFSPAYKDAGAKLLMEVAEKLSYTPKSTELDLPSPDYDKAVRLLKEAYGLDCSLEVKESILTELISLYSKLENWAGAMSYSFQYLDQFDPDWKGTLKSTTRITSTSTDKRKVKLVGGNRRLVRFHLCEAFHRSGDRIKATRYLTEFIGELKKSNNQKNLPLLADSTWLRLMALRDKGGKPRNLNAWISEVKTYLQDYPKHIHTQATAYAIAHSYLGSGNKQKAIDSLQDYINNHHNRFIEKPLTARTESKKAFLARKNQADSRHEAAHYLIGKTYLQLNEFEKAKQAWNLYSKTFPNGANWAECQKGLVDIDFSIATHAVSLMHSETDKKETRANAEKALSNFITKHPLDKRIPTALYLMGNIPFQHANELEKNLKKSPDEGRQAEQQTAYKEALENWRILITKYPRSSHAVQAQYLTAYIYEDRLGDLEKALSIYRQSSHSNAQSHVNSLLAKKLIASSDTTFSTKEKPHIMLSTRNIEKVTVRQYWLDIESYFRKARKLEDITSLDIDLIEADKKWDITLPNYKKYHAMDSKIDIPFPAKQSGICVIKIESESFSTTTMVMRSDIDIAVRSNKEEVITYAHLVGNKYRPAKNVQVLIADGGKVITTGKTDTQGVFHYRDASLTSINDLRVLAISDTGAATCSLNTASIQPTRKLTPRVWFNIAKLTYLPGETMKIGGVVRFPDEENVNYVAPTKKQRNYTLSIRTSDTKKLLYQQKITTSASGIFQHTYKLPSYLSSANLMTELTPDFGDDQSGFTQFFSVNSDAAPMISIKLDMDKKWTTHDSVINGVVTAKYRWDAPYADRQLTINLPDDRTITVKTDSKGEATFRYDTQYEEAGQAIQFSATSKGKEFYSNTATVLIDPIGFSILASTDFATVAAGEEVKLTAKTILPDETPVSRQLKLEVLQIVKIQRNPILHGCVGLEHLTASNTRQKIIQTTPLTTDDKTGEILHQLKFDKAGRYLIRVTSTDAKGRDAIARSFIDVHDSSSQKKLIIFTDKRSLEVGKTAIISTWSYFKSPARALLTVETDKIIEKRIITLKPGKNDIPLQLITAHAPRVRVNLMAIHERKFYTVSDTLPVENKLTLKVTTSKVPLNADKDKKFDYLATLQAFDANGKPVAADFFVNLTHRSRFSPEKFHRSDRLTSYRMNSNCGLIHTGRQDSILKEVRDELLRMEQQEGLTNFNPNPANLRRSITKQSLKGKMLLQKAENAYNQTKYDDAKQLYQMALKEDPYSSLARRGLEQINAAQSDYYRNAYDQTSARMLSEVDSAWEIVVPSNNRQITVNSNSILSTGGFLNNPNGELNSNGRDFFGNQNTLAMNNVSPPELQNQVSFSRNGLPNRSPNVFPITPASPLSVKFLYDEAENATTITQILSIPAKGKEILLTHEQVYGDLKLYVMGVDKTTAFGSHEEDLETNLKLLTHRPRADLAGIPVIDRKSTILGKGKHKITLKLPNKIKPTALKLTSSRSTSEFSESIISSPLVSRFSSDTPFHEPHPGGQLMAVCAYLDYLIIHKLDEPKQEELRFTASRLCADLTLSQKSNGAWSQIRNRKAASLIHTTLSYQALMMAKRLKIPYDKLTSSQALNWISAQQKSLATNLYSSRALVQLALASSGDEDFTTCNRLFRERSKMDNIGRAILANVFVLLDKNEFTTTLYSEIDENINVKHASESFLRSSILLDALTLNAALAIDKNAMVIQFTHHFESDVERGYLAYAQAKFGSKMKPEAKQSDLIFSVNGKQIKNGIIPEKLLKTGVNTIDIESDRVGAVVSAELIGRQIMQAQSSVKDFTVEDRKHYREQLSYKGLPLRSSGSSPVEQTDIGDTIQVHLKGRISNSAHPDSILIEEIPAGFSYLAGSLRGNHSGARHAGSYLIITYGSLPNKFDLRYTLIAEHAGEWTHNPSILCATDDTSKTSNNNETKLTILAKGAKNDSAYQMNRYEHYELAQLHFKANEYDEAKRHILAYRKLKQASEDPVLAQMLLWIETDKAQPNAQLLADSFEILTERNPDLVIPFDKILKVGKAYRTLGEHERSMDVYTATLEAGFNSDSYVGAALEDQGKFMLSVDYQNKLWLLYPDLGEIRNSRFALAQKIYSLAEKASSLGNNPITQKLYSKKEVIALSLKHTSNFLTHTPEHELADDAAFSLANALFALKRYDDVVKHTAKAIVTYKDSEHATSFRYMQALGNFWLRNYDRALKSASDVATGNSEDKDLAAFITAQIYHAKGLPELAIKWYKGIEKSYPDAKESIAYFEQKSISLDEVKVLNSGEKFSFKLKYRNIKEAQFQVYRVDLMKLYLREKNLSNISAINLAGITPKHSLTTQLGNGKDFQEREKIIELPVKDDGAYLVICRGDYLHTSGLVLITPLKLEVQEYPGQRSVRVNISDKKSGKYIDSVHVKAIGLNETKFKTGETDLRGIWQTANISSPSTIIAKDPKGRYAFFRSNISSSQRIDRSGDPFGDDQAGAIQLNKPKLQKKIDFNSNLKMKQDSLNKTKLLEYEKNRRSKGNGVEIKKARKQ